MPRDPMARDPIARDPIALPPEPLIRAARREDAARVVRMLRRLAAPHGEFATVGPADLEWDVLGAEPWATALLAEAAGAAVGCAVLGRPCRAAFGERCLELGSLYVEPAWRGRGVGRALVAAVLRHAEELACSRVTVGTTPAGLRARRFYEGLGFEPAPAPVPRCRMLVSPALRPA